uniref:dopamine beta-hydroxylase isoform X2 n=1 Tax=Callithrix jacchus TaxID=9483 RepID=UPI0023DD06EA|nr:dopamine beta-hydroxylase isoform X2 [Callithrix jacchus]
MQAPGRCCHWASLPSPSVWEAASMYGTAVAVFLVILVAALQGSAPTESRLPYHIPLDPEGFLELSWNISYAQEAIDFQLLVRRLKAGVLFGMSDRGKPENADLVVLWTDGDTAYFADAWSDQNGQIHLDPQQDYQLLQVQRTPEGLVLLFKRPFGTCDPKDYLIEDGTVHLVYGILEKPFQSLEAINTSGLRMGLQRVQLLKPDIPNPALPSDTYTMEIHAPNIRIPSQETTYWCHVKELPKGFPRHHIVMYEPIVTKGNEGLVHHMEVFQCPPEMDSVPYFSGPCDSEKKPDNLNYCRRVLAAWALGAKAFYYPEEAGLAFGGPGSSRYLRLEIHYHNPLVKEGQHDSSGIRLYYTPTLRRFDAGIMELGLVYTPVMAIPPQETDFVLTGYCTDSCTQLMRRLRLAGITLPAVAPSGDSDTSLSDFESCVHGSRSRRNEVYSEFSFPVNESIRIFSSCGEAPRPSQSSKQRFLKADGRWSSRLAWDPWSPTGNQFSLSETGLRNLKPHSAVDTLSHFPKAPTGEAWARVKGSVARAHGEEWPQAGSTHCPLRGLGAFDPTDH